MKSAPIPRFSDLSSDIDRAVERYATHVPTADEVLSASSTSFVETLRAARSGTLGATTLAECIDHTLLKADARRADFEVLCAEARTHGFATVCVNTGWLPFVQNQLAGAKTLPIAVIGFPLGAMDSQAKADETRRALTLGAREIDMVLTIGALKDGDYAFVAEDIAAVVSAAAPAPVKVILETTYLSRSEIIAACVIAKKAGAAFVKTSTGFATPSAGKTAGATVDDIALMRVIVGPNIGVKASGGIRTRADALRMIAAGANRVGASASVAIVSAAPSTPTSDGY